MTESLVEWLSAQLDVDQRRAEAWEHDNPDDGGYYSCPAVHTEPYGDLPWGEENCDCGLAHRKTFTLADIAAKRRIIAEHRVHWPPSLELDDVQDLCEVCEDRLNHDAAPWPCLTLRLLALPYAGRDGYQEAWRPE